MAFLLPKWLTKRYALLYEKFRMNPFTYEEAKKVLQENDELVIVVISALKKSGWIKSDRNPKDRRTRIYKLINPQKAMMEIAKENA